MVVFILIVYLTKTIFGVMLKSILAQCSREVRIWQTIQLHSGIMAMN